jgi:hypothetical protein
MKPQRRFNFERTVAAYVVAAAVLTMLIYLLRHHAR